MNTDSAAGLRIVWGDGVDEIINTPAHYRSGENCMFFAVQDAYSKLIAPGGFGEDEFTRFRKGLDDFVLFEQELAGSTKGLPHQTLAMSLLFLVPYLREKSIKVTAIYAQSEAVENVKKIYKNLEELPFVEVNSESSFEPPFLAIVNWVKRGESHIFYAHDVDDYYEKIKIHMHPGDTIQSIVSVERVKNQQSF